MKIGSGIVTVRLAYISFVIVNSVAISANADGLFPALIFLVISLGVYFWSDENEYSESPIVVLLAFIIIGIVISDYSIDDPDEYQPNGLTPIWGQWFLINSIIMTWYFAFLRGRSEETEKDASLGGRIASGIFLLALPLWAATVFHATLESAIARSLEAPSVALMRLMELSLVSLDRATSVLPVKPINFLFVALTLATGSAAILGSLRRLSTLLGGFAIFGAFLSGVAGYTYLSDVQDNTSMRAFRNAVAKRVEDAEAHYKSLVSNSVLLGVLMATNPIERGQVLLDFDRMIDAGCRAYNKTRPRGREFANLIAVSTRLEGVRVPHYLHPATGRINCHDSTFRTVSATRLMRASDSKLISLEELRSANSKAENIMANNFNDLAKTRTEMERMLKGDRKAVMDTIAELSKTEIKLEAAQRGIDLLIEAISSEIVEKSGLRDLRTLGPLIKGAAEVAVAEPIRAWATLEGIGLGSLKSAGRAIAASASSRAAELFNIRANWRKGVLLSAAITRILVEPHLAALRANEQRRSEAARSANRRGYSASRTTRPKRSDRRLKRDIRYLGDTSAGLRIYVFKYLWSDEEFVGLMAQDLISDSCYVKAVTRTSDGFYAVDYTRIGLKVATFSDWVKYGFRAVFLDGAVGLTGNMEGQPCKL